MLKGIVTDDSVAVLSQFLLQFSFDVRFATLLSFAPEADLFTIEVFDASATVDEDVDDNDFVDDDGGGTAAAGVASATSLV